VKKKQASRRIGLARALSKLGYCSRSRAAELIRAGHVRLNGKVSLDPEMPVSKADNQIAVEGEHIQRREKTYLMMNKPRGLLTTASDEKGRETVYTLLNQKASLPWVAPIGRLDKASEGLLLLTNDSEWGARVAAPETHLAKTYHVQIGAIADANFVQALIQGVKSKDGELLGAKQSHLLRAGQQNCWLEIVLDEGRNRQIRRMMESFGVEVLRLVRVAIGPLQLGNLAKGECRALAADEKRMLDHAMRRPS
jgi:23S rRNA pseudouridine2605 synthase